MNTLMTTHPLGKIGRCVLWFSPVVIVVVGFLAAIPWLKQQNDTFVLALAAVASIFVMGYALFISHRLQRDLDEVQIASAGFASSRGWVWGAMATVRSEEHTSELQSLMRNSYAVFCLKKKEHNDV